MILLLVSILSFSAYAVENCDIFTPEELRTILDVTIPNCLTPGLLEEEAFQQEDSQHGPICGECKSQLLARVPISPAHYKRVRQQAYFEGMANEYKKALSTVMLDLVTLRSGYSSLGTYSQTTQKCNSQHLQRQIDQRCSNSQKGYFESANIHGVLGNELAILLSPSPLPITGTFQRIQEENSCQIPAQTVLSLKTHMPSRLITPEHVRQISQAQYTDKNEIFLLLNNLELKEAFKSHPVLKALTEDPVEFKRFFQGLTQISDVAQLRASFNERINSSGLADRLDMQMARQCESATSHFISKVCSRAFDDGDISLGNFQIFEKYNNNAAPPESATISSEALLNRNLALVDFCSERTSTRLNLRSDSEQITEWLLPNERRASLNEHASRINEESVQSFRAQICNFSNNAQGCQDSSFGCQLYQLYQEHKREGSPLARLSSSPDQRVNRILGAMINGGQGTSPEARQVLIAEGILPQSNGQFVERPEVPERRPDYLANVANGTINPSTGTSSAVAQSSATRNTRPQQAAQSAVFQPQPQGSGASPEAQAAGIDPNDTEALRRFQDQLDARLDRLQTQTGVAPSGQTRPGAPQPRRDSPRRGTQERAPELPTGFTPTPQDTAQPIAGAPTFTAPEVPEASLGEDPNRQTRAQIQRNAALMDFARKNNPELGSQTGGRAPASANEPGATSSDNTVALTISGDIQANLERVISGSDESGANLRTLLQNRSPFRFQLNGATYDVQFSNGTYVVTYRSGNAPRGADVANTLQSVFNNSLRSTALRGPNSLDNLRNNFRN